VAARTRELLPNEFVVGSEITDTRTHLLLRNDEGIVRASLETEDPAVHEWAERLHREYWTSSSPLTLDYLPE
jgi:hypothetical protein